MICPSVSSISYSQVFMNILHISFVVRLYSAIFRFRADVKKKEKLNQQHHYMRKDLPTSPSGPWLYRERKRSLRARFRWHGAGTPRQTSRKRGHNWKDWQRKDSWVLWPAEYDRKPKWVINVRPYPSPLFLCVPTDHAPVEMFTEKLNFSPFSLLPKACDMSESKAERLWLSFPLQYSGFINLFGGFSQSG